MNPNCQIAQQRKRWNSRAENWDMEVSNPGHYANFEGGYEKFIALEKRELSNIREAEVGIDLGCGTGIASLSLSKKVKTLYLLDIAENMLKVAKKRIPNAILLNASATEIPLPNDSVDVAVSRGIVVSHLPEELTNNFFDELGRIVRCGGKVVFDFLSNSNSAQFKNRSPKTSFTKANIRRELERRGFGRLVFDNEDTNRVVRVSATKIKSVKLIPSDDMSQ